MDPARPYIRRLVDPLLDHLLVELSGLMVVGPRAAGKTTTIGRRAATTVQLDIDAQAAAFRADPKAALRGLDEPVLLDEWQKVPGVLAAIRHAVDADPRPNRFFVTGSVRAEIENEVWQTTGRLIRIAMYPMTIREQVGRVEGAAFFDKLAAGEELVVPSDTPDLRGYVELALRSGLPVPALDLTGRARQSWLESYVTDLLTHDIGQLEQSTTKPRDSTRLQRYFEAYALNSASIADHKTIYDAAQINKLTAIAYEQTLSDLLVAEQVPAWASNRLRRLVRQPKRYLVDPALIATALRLDENAILADGDLLGRILDTFVFAQLRPELEVASTRPRLFHLRTKGGRQEIDLIAELAGQQIVGIEIKADAAPDPDSARHLAWLREEIGDRFAAGVVFHTGPRTYQLGDKITAAPISALWG